MKQKERFFWPSAPDLLRYLAGFTLAVAFACGLAAIWTTGQVQDHLGNTAFLFGFTTFMLFLGSFLTDL